MKALFKQNFYKGICGTAGKNTSENTSELMRSKINFLILVAIATAFSYQSTAWARAGTQTRAKAEKSWREIAIDEITLPETVFTENSNASAATVVISHDEITSPLQYDGVQLGVFVQNYQPMGSGRLISVGEYDFSALSPQAMFGLQLRTMPWGIKSLGAPQLGLVLTGGYAQHKPDIQTPSGASLERTRLDSTLVLFGGSAEWQLMNRFRAVSLALDIAAGRMDVSQSSANGIADISDRLWLASFGASARYRFHNTWAWLGYERRMPIYRGESRLGVQDNTISLGLLYAIR